MLAKHLGNEKIGSNELAELDSAAAHSTEQEIAAAEAERASVKLKQVEYMQEKIGMEFEGVISGVTEWGMYVEENDSKAEGMIKMRELGDDYFILDEKNYAIVGERTKKRYRLGDRVRFTVQAADPERKTLDYALA